jgi:methylmalonyl-CoA/ethylmalonyl-CoA epimerase
MAAANRLIQVAQRAEDLSRATDFYRRLLGSEPTRQFDPPGLVFFDLGGTRLLLDRVAPSALLYIGVDDVHGRVEELRADGVAIEGEPHVIFHHDDDTLGPAGSDEWMAFVKDSEGNTIGLVSRAPGTAPDGR